LEIKQPGNKKMPDFVQLNDRIIAESGTSPMLVIKTNLDPKDTAENNPYYHNGQAKKPKAMNEYFEE
jgi:hypothetical protein